MKKISKKDIPAKTVVKALITGFTCYGILVGFILMLIESICYSAINLESSNSKVLIFSLPLLFAFVQYFVIHWICRLSTADLFSKCKTKASNTEEILPKMNLFFLICVLILVLAFNAILILKLADSKQNIEYVSAKEAQVFSEEHTELLKNEMIAQYNEEKNRNLFIYVVSELSLVVSFFSLIPYQKKMILEYNETGKRTKTEE